MTRLVSWPAGLGSPEGDTAAGTGNHEFRTTTALDGFEQSFDNPFDALHLRMLIQITQGTQFRRMRGWLRSLRGNATRWSYLDVDRMSAAEAGVIGTFRGSLWSNGQTWSNGTNWAASYPDVGVAAAAERGATVVSLADGFWGHSLGIGDVIGFYPFHLGAYEVTRVFEPGRYLLDLPLRKAITSQDRCTLDPAMALRLVNENSIEVERNESYAEGVTAIFAEAQDYDVREFYTD